MSGWDETVNETQENAEKKAEEKAPPRKSLVMVRADEVEMKVLRYMWKHRIPLGAMTLMPGEEGIGKTTVGVRLMSDLTRGLLPGEFRGTPKDVVVVALEDQLQEVFLPRLHAAGVDRSRLHIIRAAKDATTGEQSDLVLPDDLDALSAAIKDLDVAMVWVDSLVTTLPDDMKSIAYKDTAKVLRRLGSWAEEHNLAVVAPWHLNKAKGTDTAVRIMDSRAFRTGVRSMLLIVADPEDVSQGIVVLDKFNAGTLKVEGLKYRIDGVDVDVNGETTSAGKVVWTDTIDGATAREIARGLLDDGMKKKGGATTVKEWLADYLTEQGEMDRVDVMCAAAVEGHSESAVKRAATSLGVHSRVITGQQEGRPFRRTAWSLASVGSPADHPRPTEPTDPTGESSHDLIDPISAGQAQSGQSGQSVMGGEGEPTGELTEFVVVPLDKLAGGR